MWHRSGEKKKEKSHLLSNWIFFFLTVKIFRFLFCGFENTKKYDYYVFGELSSSQLFILSHFNLSSYTFNHGTRWCFEVYLWITWWKYIFKLKINYQKKISSRCAHFFLTVMRHSKFIRGKIYKQESLFGLKVLWQC